MASRGQVLHEEGLPAVLRRPGAEDYFISSLVVVAVVFAALLLNAAFAHWFLLPLVLCGVLSFVDLVRWWRRRLDAFDPQTVIGFISFYGLFVAPLLHVAWDRFGAGYDFILRGDWRPWLGGMAMLNAAGLILYRAAQSRAYRHTSRPKSLWHVDSEKLLPSFGGGIAFSAAGLVLLYSQMGGIGGIIRAYESSREEFLGRGWMLILAWPLTVLSVMTLTMLIAFKSGARQRGLWNALSIPVIAGIGHFLLLGWYGSRSATVWAIFWIAGIVHYRLRPLSTRTLAGGFAVLIAFMYFYGFYKEQGRQGLDVLRDPEMWLDPSGYRRDLRGMFLGDLARADTTAYVLHNLIKSPANYDYRWGLTYPGAFSILIPRPFWPDRPKFKVEAGTEAQHGKGSPWESSRVYGLNGEAMLNFGPLGVPLAFALYGAALGWYRKKYHYWDKQDARLFLAPFITVLFVMAFVGDSDNLVFGAITQGVLPVSCVYLASRKQSLPAGPHLT